MNDVTTLWPGPGSGSPPPVLVTVVVGLVSELVILAPVLQLHAGPVPGTRGAKYNGTQVISIA